ncbi:gliding motility lipoprotein GldD [Flavobacterium sp.]|uniref:gliding motility lipoprotein GldD n=1 Tax=Flavobacterium sp. TaxID=239 RepID=UPI004048DE23
MQKILFTLLAFIIISCADETVPKPKGQLRLEYPNAEYYSLEKECPYTFELNDRILLKGKENCAYELHYPKMKATVYLTYKKVENNIEYLLRDAQKLTYDHVVKADDITEQPFINAENKVYGMFYEVGGDAATNAQFYVTDSTKNFMVGSLYFYAKPNYDSIMPAVSYIKNDIRKLVETLKWK